MRVRTIAPVLAAAACLIALVVVAPAMSALVKTEIKSVRLDNVNGLTGKGDYSGKIKPKRCAGSRHIKVIHLSDPPFTIGETDTNEDGEWELNGNVPPPGTPQRIKVVVTKEGHCKGASRSFDIDDIS